MIDINLHKSSSPLSAFCDCTNNSSPKTSPRSSTYEIKPDAFCPVKCNVPPPLLFPSHVISREGERRISFPFGLIESTAEAACKDSRLYFHLWNIDLKIICTIVHPHHSHLQSDLKRISRQTNVCQCLEPGKRLSCLCAIMNPENEPNPKVYGDAFPSRIR